MAGTFQRGKETQDGKEMTSHRGAASNLVELLRERARTAPEQPAYCFLVDGEEKEAHLTYAELDRRARALGAVLQRLGAADERALLLYPPGLDYIAAFFGCLYAGAVAVPAYPPRPNRPSPRLRSIADNASPRILLTVSALRPLLERMMPAPAGSEWLATDDPANLGAPGDWRDPGVEPATLAFLQYTSGSTAAPKGVMLSHANLLHNLELIRVCFAQTARERTVIWLPPYHDMGLIGGILEPLYAGYPVTLMSPMAFLQQPLRWLRAISRTRATTSGGPNFAYDLCVRKINEEQRRELDLSSWSLAFNGAEPIRPDTLERFAAAFSSCGFRRESFYPCYGLAEATLLASGGRRLGGAVVRSFAASELDRHRAVPVPAAPGQRTLVGCGGPADPRSGEPAVAIVRPDSAEPCAPDEVGEIWLQGPSVAQGYWRQPEETARVFQARLAAPAGPSPTTLAPREDLPPHSEGVAAGPCLRTGDLPPHPGTVPAGPYLRTGDLPPHPGTVPTGPYLRTGDLGFISGGELFVTGRLKDLIILRGRNHYPQDIELTVERSHPGLRPGCGAAFAVEAEGEERLVVAQELHREHRQSDAAAIVEAIRRAVADEHEVAPDAVVLLAPATIPKTSSGKIQRHACRAGFLAGTLDAIVNWTLASGVVRPGAAEGPKPSLPSAAPQAAGDGPRPSLGSATPEGPGASPKPSLPSTGPEAAAMAPPPTGSAASPSLPAATPATAPPAPRPDAAELARWLAAEVARRAGVAISAIDPGQPIGHYPLDSLAAMELMHAIENRAGVSVSMETFFSATTLADLAATLASGWGQAAPAGTPERPAPAAGFAARAAAGGSDAAPATTATTPERPAPAGASAAQAAAPGPDAAPALAAAPPADSPTDTPADGPEGEFRLSRAQLSLWFLHTLEPGSPAYNVPNAVRVAGELDTASLRGALRLLADRHPALRTTFTAAAGEPMQRVARHGNPGDLEIAAHDAVSWSEEQLAAHLAAESVRPFDLERGPLVRVRLYTRSATEHLLLLSMHHIVTDFWSLGVLLDELATLYLALRAGRPPLLPPAPAPYSAFARWQERELAGPAGAALWDYWRERLAGELPVVDLPADRPRPRVQTTAGRAHRRTLAAPLGGGVHRLAREAGATPFVVLLAAFEALLHRYTGAPDLLLGTVSAARTRAAFARTAGYFVNPLVLRAELGGDPGLASLVARARRDALGAFAHQDFPFALLVERLQPQRDPGRSPLFQVLFVLQKAQLADGQDLTGFALGEPGSRVELGGPGGLALAAVPLEQRIAQFDLTLTLGEVGGRLIASFDYNTDLFDAATVERLAAHFERLLATGIADPARAISELPLLDAAEERQLLETWNDTRVSYRRDATVAELFAEQAAATPEAVAVVFAGGELTYAELHRRAERLAAVLRRLGVGPEVLVGVCVERSFDVLVAALGVLAAGGAYLPIDPEYPRERVAHLLATARVGLLLTHEKLRPLGGAFGADRAGAGPRLLCLDGDWEAAAAAAESAAPPAPALAANAACAIFTSGSTGLPKGVLLEHRNLVNLIASFVRSYRPVPGDRILPLTSIAYASFVGEVLPLLCAGGTVVLPQKHEVLDVEALVSLIAARGVSMVSTVPSMLASLNAIGDRLPRLRLLLVGGETLRAADADRLLRGAAGRAAAVRLVNGYGLTETTICSTTYTVPPADLAAGLQPPIGKPLMNQRVYVLDRHFRPQPAGVAGALYVAGDGLARGYLGRPDETAARFLPDPQDAGGRMYRTGDLAALRADGNLVYLGRGDSQVKVRGFRIELGEIESALSLHPGVREAAAAVRADPDPRLVGYVVPRPGPAPTAGELLAWLREKLPDYMVPAVLVFLDALPVNANGKVDGARLPAPERTRPELAAAYTAPRSELERTIAGVWREALQVESVGLEDNFFDLGGHSLLMAKVHARLREALGREISLIELFQYPRIGALARHLAGAGAGASAHPAAAPRAAGPAGAAAARNTLRPDPSGPDIWRPDIPGPAISGPGIPAHDTRGRGAETDIAVIGLAGRFPGAPDVRHLWLNLVAGREGITFFAAEELIAAGIDPELVARPDYVRAKGVLGGVDLFDAAFFGLNPREVELMDPQHRVFLECAWEALEDAGWDADRFPGLVGVYAGASMNTYLLMNLLSHLELVASADTLQASLGNDKDPLTARVSYKLNLKGPSVTIQSASSTSLVAVHSACQALINRDCDMALAGGVSIHLPETSGYLYQEGGTVSSDGHCRAFDAGSTGFVSGHGCGVVVLKRLSAALADGDHVYAVIKGSACNNDGSHKVSFMAPSVAGQVELYKLAYDRAGVATDTVSYVECHGTGTAMGDPIEIAALSQAFGAPAARQGSCAIGSVKTNIGHLDTAAGVCGLIKAVLALHHRTLPPSLHFRRPNPRIPFAGSPFFVNTELRPWEVEGGGPRRAGVTSLGMGGTNAHVVLEEAPPPAPASASRPHQLLLLSAKSAAALERATVRLADHLRQSPGLDLPDVAFTLTHGRKTFQHRRALLVSGASGARDLADGVSGATGLASGASGLADGASGASGLADGASGASGLADGVSGATGLADGATGLADAALALETLDPERILTTAPEPGDRPVAFLFPGQGAQYLGMGRGLYDAEPSFRADVDLCCRLLQPHLGLDLRQALFADGADLAAGVDRADFEAGPHGADFEGGAAAARLQGTELAQPALFVVSWAMARLWMSWGVRPEAMLGHSVGEYVAACLAGVFSLADALALVAVRGRLMSEMPPGAMLGIPLPEADVLPLLGEELSLAAVNRPTVCVVSGPAAAIGVLAARLAGQGLACRRLHTSHAFHSRMMEPVLQPFLEQVERVRLEPPRLPFLSNVTGTWIRPEEATDPAYWARQLRRAVRFADGVALLLAEPHRILLEIGPGHALSTLARQHPAAGPGHTMIATLRHPKQSDADPAFLLHALARFWLAGGEVDWAGFWAGERRRRLSLPSYPFERRRYWIDPLPAAGRPPGPAAVSTDPAKWFYVPVWKQSRLPISVAAPEAAAPATVADAAAVPVAVPAAVADAAPALAAEAAPAAATKALPAVAATLAAVSDVARTAAAAPAAQAAAVPAAAAAALPAPAPSPETWLVFLDRCNLGETLALQLEESGRSVIRVAEGETFSRGPAGFTVAPGRRADYDALLEALDRPVQHVLHLWNVTAGASAIDAALDRTFYSLVFLAQALGRRSVTDPTAITVVSNGVCDVSGEEPLDPLKATLLGPVTVIPREYPNLSCRSVDVTLGGPGSLARTAGQILVEIGRAPELPAVAWRGNLRWVRRYEPMPLPAGAPPRLRQGGVCLITGGLGGIGLELAEHLAREAQARLVLVSRSPFPERERWADWLALHDESDAIRRRIERLLIIEELGGEVLALSADVADPAAMREVLAAAERRFGAVHGLIHAAGVPGGGLLQGKVREATERVLAPKVRGTLVLADLFAGADLDLFVLNSSLTVLLPQVGQAGYVAANAFLDAFAAARARTGAAAVAIGWDAWRETGMAVATEVPEEWKARRQESLAQGLASREGVEAFRRIVGSGLPQAVVSKGDLDSRWAENERLVPLAALAAAAPAAPAAAAHPRPALATAYVQPQTDLERAVAGVWQEILGVEPVGLHDNFFELGGNSLAGLRLVQRLRERLGIGLSEVSLYEAPTVGTLARMIAAQSSTPEVEAPIGSVAAAGSLAAAGSVAPDGSLVPAGSVAPAEQESRQRGERRKARLLGRRGAGGETDRPGAVRSKQGDRER
jgi:amino acid adenylation domain-containing protein